MIVELRAEPRDARYGKARDIKSYKVRSRHGFDDDIFFNNNLHSRLGKLAGGTDKVRMGIDEKSGALFFEVSNGAFSHMEPRFVGEVNDTVDYITETRTWNKD